MSQSLLSITRMTPDQKILYKAIEEYPDITSGELQRIFLVTRQTMWCRLDYLLLSGLIKTKKINKQGLRTYSIDKRRHI